MSVEKTSLLYFYFFQFEDTVSLYWAILPIYFVISSLIHALMPRSWHNFYISFFCFEALPV